MDRGERAWHLQALVKGFLLSSQEAMGQGVPTRISGYLVVKCGQEEKE